MTSAEPNGTHNGETGPLAGVTVVDTTSMLMGPYCTELLAELGARVIKVEPPGGDIARGIADHDGQRLGPIYLNANRGKESIVLDLRDGGDHRVFEQIVARADVIVHNRPKGSDVRIGMDYETLSAINPRVIVCGMLGFGSTGRYGALPAYDDVIQGICGLAAHQGGSGPPQYVRTPMTDKVAAVLGVGVVCAALYERERSGRGQYVEVPMFETMVHFLLLEQQGGYVYDPPRGNAGYSRTDSPFRVPLPTTDGLISMLPSTDNHWNAVFKIFNREDLCLDPRYASIAGRTENIDDLYRWLTDEIAKHPTQELLEMLQEASVPAMHVNTIPDLFDDPHLVETGFFETVSHPESGQLRQARAPFTFSRSGSRSTGPAPALDRDGARLRTELGD
jgi:crotonobetainyl-CoA:carnitine CoA-transferase CaiB-like acyl-CoA transferase